MSGRMGPRFRFDISDAGRNPARHRPVPRRRKPPVGALWAPLALCALLLLSAWAPTKGDTRVGEGPASFAAAPEVVASPLAAATSSLHRGAGPAAGSAWSCQDLGSSSEARCSSARASATSAGWSREGPGPDGNIGAGYYPIASRLVYDAKDGYAVLLTSGSTWTYAAGRWTVLDSYTGPGNSSGAPGACEGSALTYDPTAGYVLLFEAGVSNCSDAGQTWTFSAGAWTQLTPANAPPADYSVAWMGTIPSSGDVLLFDAGVLATPWTFSNGTWSPASAPTNTSPSGEGTLVYDSEDNAVLDFVTDTEAGYSNQTWEYRSGEWAELSPTNAPSPRDEELLVDDPADGYVVLLGGYSESGDQALHDLWTFHAGVWTNRTSSSAPVVFRPASEYLPSTTFDPALGGVMVLDAAEEVVANGSLLWTYHAGVWTNLSTASPPPGVSYLTYDAADGYAVLLPSEGSTWTFADGVWTELNLSVSPPPGPMSYDASSGYVVLFSQGETWEFVGGVWAELTPTATPPGCEACSLAYDPLEGYVLYATWIGGASETWEFENGTWANLTAGLSHSPDGAPANPLVYDPALGGVLMFGTTTYNDSNLTNQSWLFTGATWEELSASGEVPPPVESAAFAYDPAAGGALLFGGFTYAEDQSSDTNSTWVLQNATWTQITTSPAPSPRSDAGLVFGTGVPGLLLFGGAGGPPGCPEVEYLGEGCGDWWTWSLTGTGGGPTVLSVGAEPNPVDAGVDVTITVHTLGGTSPLSYAYAGLPPGCQGANVSSITCAPSASGSFTVGVTVTDARGNRSSGETGLVVVPGPAIASFVADPTSVAVGVRTLLEASVSGGMAPYTYAYTDLPPGCFSQDVPVLPCVPQAAGAYTPALSVSDAEAATVSSTTPLAVTASGAPGSPSIADFTVSPPTVVLGNTTAFAVTASEGSHPLSYSYAGLPPGCTAGNSSSFSCIPSTAGAYVVTVAVTDPSGNSSRANLTLDVVPVGSAGHPLVRSFLATPSELTLGNSTILVVVVNGSTSGLSYAYRGLPAGCTSENTSQLACVPRASGSFRVVLTVTNPSHNATSVPTTVQVVGRSAPAAPSTSWPPYAGWLLSGLGGVIAVLAIGWGLSRISFARRKAEGERWLRKLSEDEGREGPPGPGA